MQRGTVCFVGIRQISLNDVGLRITKAGISNFSKYHINVPTKIGEKI